MLVSGLGFKFYITQLYVYLKHSLTLHFLPQARVVKRNMFLVNLPG